MYAYFAFHKIHMRPSEFANLPQKEKALCIAFIEERIKQEKKEAARAKRKGSKRK